MTASTPTNESPDSWFGTDGIRGVAGEGVLAPDAVVRIGRALGRFARARASGEGPARVLVAGDPRPSTESIVKRLTGAMLDEGALVLDMGIAPTPALAWVTADGGFDLGVMVSASHNPPQDNGIKPFAGSGRKLTEAEEAEIEAAIAEASPEADMVEPPRDLKARDHYIERTTAWLADGGRLDGQRIVVDLAAGAATTTAPDVLRGLGADVELLHAAGERAINDGCGSQHPERWLAAVAASKADAGLAFDGDADRIVVAASNGDLLDGDDMLAILAEDAYGRGGVPADVVVSTIMANLGLEERVATFGARLERTPVGDRQVAARMRELDAVMGGEPSGHVVLPRDDLGGEPALIGDALVAGVRVLQATRRLGTDLASLRASRPRYPQVLVGVLVAEKRPIEDWPALADAIAEQEAALKGAGRLVVRYSGTESLLRIMAQGRESVAVDAAVRAIERVAEAGPA